MNVLKTWLTAFLYNKDRKAPENEIQELGSRIEEVGLVSYFAFCIGLVILFIAYNNMKDLNRIELRQIKISNNTIKILNEIEEIKEELLKEELKKANAKKNS